VTGRLQLTIVGDALLDRDVLGRADRVCPDAPVPVVEDVEERARPGGAGLAAWLAARDGAAVTLVTALGDDPAAEELRGLLEDAGVRVLALRRHGGTPEKVRVRAGAQSIVRIDRGDSGRVPIDAPPPAVARALENASAVLVSDYGGGMTFDRALRQHLARVADGLPVVWDPHPRGTEPVRGCAMVTPNRSEAFGAASGGGVLPVDGPVTSAVASIASAARALLDGWGARAVCVTLGSDGAVLVAKTEGVFAVPAPAIRATDACGAGDRFATAAALVLADRQPLAEAVARAVETASAYVSDGAGWSNGATERSQARPSQVSGRELPTDGTRSRGVVVATSGCFDLLHAGHVRMLRAARRLGDRLVVCLNDDDSVARLKGPGRPIVPAPERAELLLALDCVDDVVVFAEDTPERVLADLRPDVFAKGADYTIAQLPEATVLASWGGETVILPYEAGRSTTELIARSRPTAPSAT
jgi:D-beta-D-heptose 7-phosphate kinase/D-beta-D-heptose 1-phosphate adenosyltransferase